MRSVGTPAETMASRRPMRSLADIELASELVPNTASPQSWLSSHLQWAMKRPTSGDRSRLKGVTTGERTPLIRAAAMILFLPGEWRACSATERRRRPVTNYEPAAHRDVGLYFLHFRDRLAQAGRFCARADSLPPIELGYARTLQKNIDAS